MCCGYWPRVLHRGSENGVSSIGADTDDQYAAPLPVLKGCAVLAIGVAVPFGA